jgi:hypothetical protein
MKTKFVRVITALALCAGVHQAAAQGTAFTYQGQLQNNGGPASGTYNLTFTIYKSSTLPVILAGPVTNNGVIVTNGLFTVLVDFGAGVFNGATNWLGVAVETNGGAGFTPLTPRQQVTPTPYAIYAENASSVGGVAPTNFWQIGGNAGTTGVLGTTDNHALDLIVNGGSGLLLQPGAANTINVAVGPFSGVGTGLSGVTIAGGGYLGGPNLAYENWTTISGGFGNQIGIGCSGGVIAGGQDNQILTGSGQGAVGGGYANVVGIGATGGTIPGGWNNLVSGTYGFAAGNTAQATNSGAFVWADNSGGAFTSTSNNQFSARATGGVRFVTGGAGVTIDGQPVPTGSGWGLTGNAGTSYGTDFMGTTDNEPLELKVNGVVAETLWPFASGNPSVALGPNSFFYLYGTGGSFVGPGGSYGAGANITYGDFCVIGGGYGDKIYAVGADYSVISGGYQNYLLSEGAVIGGGFNNTNAANYATIPGGANNSVSAAGTYGFAAGENATVANAGSFVWSDGTGTATTSFANNQFMARASGGVVLLTSTAASPTSYATGSAGVALLPNATAWTTVSDRNAKKNFHPVDAVSVLDKLAAIPIEQWNYKWEKDSDVPNIGPMAQDFKQAFYPGRDDKGISTLEFDGVELAAIQGLNQKLNEKNEEIEALEQSVAELKQMVQTLAEKK